MLGHIRACACIGIPHCQVFTWDMVPGCVARTMPGPICTQAQRLSAIRQHLMLT